MYNHKWVMGTDLSRLQWHDWAADTNYNFHPELDEDIKITHKNIRNAENSLGHTWNLLQINSESDPICGSAGCHRFKHPKKPLGYPINYSVPNFGRDHDIRETKASLDVAQKMYDHKLDTRVLEVPHNQALDTLYDFHPKLDSEIKTTHHSAKIASESLGLGGNW